MNAIQIKQVLRRERSADSLDFVSNTSQEFYFHKGKLKFPLFEWPSAIGFTLVIWFKNGFQMLFRGEDAVFQLTVSGSIISLGGTSHTFAGQLTDWNFLCLTQTPSKYYIALNHALVANGKTNLPQTRLWDDCCLETMSGVGDLVIFQQILKDEEVDLIGREMHFKGIYIAIQS